ncbi:ATP-binding protein [Ideonella sp.]|uniref:hybrid sensor histidine kinase/response regulator n=1 Tax=Ideonella sp. TaxID=1929293 RepID=UPI003BB6B0E5
MEPEQRGAPAEPAGAHAQHALLREQVEALFSFAPAASLGSALGIAVVLALFGSHAPEDALWPWCGANALLWLARSYQALHWHLRRSRAHTMAALQRARDLCYGLTLCSGLLWGVSAWLFFDRSDPMSQALLVIIVFSFCVAAVPVLAHRPGVFYGYLLLAFGPLIARVASSGQDRAVLLAGVLLLILGSMTVLGGSTRRAFERGVRLKLETEGLLQRLRDEMARSEDARATAERANLAKTRFFAAASHDLRQPLHAMGLFAGTLASKVGRDPELRQLVQSINASVDALEGLFSELMDITRIDSGGVAARPANFAVAGLFERLRLHFEPVAFDKGLSLRFRGAMHHALADPVLVERIVRNLVANAIAYTEDGGVLVGARVRGARLLIEVWDSGVGIAPDERVRIFEEFYRCQAEARPVGQREGLGLGLAIVQRLAALVEAPLHLRSIPGRGSVFSLSLPLGRAERALPTAPAVAPAVLSMTHRLVLVLEDDATVRDGLVRLLKDWGAGVIAFDSVAACEAWAQAVEPSLLAPDLLLVDYRLEPPPGSADALADRPRSGLDAVVLLRQCLGRPVPAVLISGSFDSALESQAQAAQCHLLQKPVLPHKLRAMVAYKLSQTPVARTG